MKKSDLLNQFAQRGQAAAQKCYTRIKKPHGNFLFVRVVF
jgi:hypothetical protein